MSLTRRDLEALIAAEARRRHPDYDDEQIKRFVAHNLPAVAARHGVSLDENTGGDKGKLTTYPYIPSLHDPMQTAPWRFVPVNPRVAMRRAGEDPVDLDTPEPGGLSGWLDVTWELASPLLIGEADEQNRRRSTPFVLRTPTDYAIPGASLKGMIRAAVECIAHGRLWQANRHRRFALRDFDHPTYRGRLLPGKMGAGWMVRQGDGYAIIPCRDWGFVKIEDLPFVDDRNSWAGEKRNRKYDLAADYKDVRREPENDYRLEASFGVRPADKDLGKPLYGLGGRETGYLVFSDKVPPSGRGGEYQKYYECVFFDPPGGGAPVALTDAAMATFLQVNTKPSANKDEPLGAWKALKASVDGGQRVPVFYVGELARNGEDPGFAFGLTRLFRLPHPYTLGDMIARAQPDGHDPAPRFVDGKPELRPDLVDDLFGYVFEPGEMGWQDDASTEKGPGSVAPRAIARKGRVAFGFARPVEPKALKLWPEQPVSTVMGVPQPSYAPFYLQGEEKDYSSNRSSIAGRKRYVAPPASADTLEGRLKDQVTRAREGGVKEGTDTHSRMQFLVNARDDAPAQIRGRIRLHNVRPRELGMLLWALTFGGAPGERLHAIGRAKAFGAGRLRVVAIAGSFELNDGGDRTLAWTPANGADAKTYLDAFEVDMEDRIPGWRDSPPVRGFLDACDPDLWANGNLDYLRYVTQENGKPRQAKDYQSLRRASGMMWGPNERYPDPRRPPEAPLSALRSDR